MIVPEINPNRYFRLPATEMPAEPVTGLDDDLTSLISEDKKHIYCRRCSRKITDIGKRISINGAHRHHFANPEGIIYEIGCFYDAEGCAYTGTPTHEFTWFKGFSWQAALCGRCLTHLGWLFIGPSRNTFNGLILEKLMAL